MITFIKPRTIVVLGCVVVLGVVGLVVNEKRSLGLSENSERKKDDSTLSSTVTLPNHTPIETPTPAPPRERILQFPEDKSIGKLEVRDWDSVYWWTAIGEARGRVNISAGKDVRLNFDLQLHDLSPLSTLPPDALHTLNIDNLTPSIPLKGIDDADLDHITHLTSLRYIHLSGHADITDFGIARLARLRHLQIVSIGDLSITDASVEYLKRLTSLRILWIFNTDITKSGWRELRQALPKCKIGYRMRQHPTLRPPSAPPNPHPQA